jgi:hypothetical protein
MGPKPGHEAGGTGTVSRIPPQNDSQCEGDPHTHVDSTDPFRLLIGTECSPFFPYHWVCTRALTIRARYTHCRPDKDENNRECSMEVHD